MISLSVNPWMMSGEYQSVIRHGLKIPKGLSEAVNRMTNNTIIYKTLHRKLTIDQH